MWLGAFFSTTQTTAIFGVQDITKCLYNLFLVIQRTGRISLADFSDLLCHPRAVPLGCFYNIPSINSPHKCTVFSQFSA